MAIDLSFIFITILFMLFTFILILNLFFNFLLIVFNMLGIYGKGPYVSVFEIFVLFFVYLFIFNSVYKLLYYILFVHKFPPPTLNIQFVSFLRLFSLLQCVYALKAAIILSRVEWFIRNYVESKGVFFFFCIFSYL